MRTTLTNTKLSVELRVRLYAAQIVSALIYGCEAWLFTDGVTRKLISKMLPVITKRTIHDEAREPTYDAVERVYRQRWSYLGHLLRLDEDRVLRRYLLELSQKEAPFITDSLLTDTEFDDVQSMVHAVKSRQLGGIL